MWPSRSDLAGFQGRCQDPGFQAPHKHSILESATPSRPKMSRLGALPKGEHAVPVCSWGVSRSQNFQCRTERILGKRGPVGHPSPRSLVTDRRELPSEMPVFKCSKVMAAPWWTMKNYPPLPAPHELWRVLQDRGQGQEPDV